MKRYYYTVAALPVVRLQEQPDLTPEAFLDHCDTFLSARDRDLLRWAQIWLPSTQFNVASEGNGVPAQTGRRQTGGDQSEQDQSNVASDREDAKAARERSVVLSTLDAFLQSLQLRLAHYRSTTMGWDAENLPPISSNEPVTDELVRHVTAEEDPLKSELAIIRATWDLLESLQVGRYFDIEILIIYFLQLQLSLRRSSITNAEAGRKELNRQYAIAAQAISEIGHE